MPTPTSSRLEALEARTLLSLVYPSNAEQYLVEIMNRARANPGAEAARYGIDLNYRLAPGTISPAAKQPLALNPMLVDSARVQSRYCLSVGYLTHYGANGSFLDTRMSAAGYQWVWFYKGMENIAAQPVGSDMQVAESLNKILFVDNVVASGAGHRQNILDPVLKEVGAGIVSGMFGASPGAVGTEDFAVSSYLKGATFLTGVAYSDAILCDRFYTPGEGLANVTITARRSDGLTYSMNTWSSGGYTMAIMPGTYTVTATGGGLGGTVTYSNIAIGTDNTKLDFRPDMVTGGTSQQTPFAGTPLAIPAAGSATLEAENFDNGGEAIAYHDTDAANLGGQYRSTGVDITTTSGGYYVGWTRPGEWLEYTVSAAQSGTCNLDFRIASQGAGGAMHVELDGVNVTGSLTVPNTGGWLSWQTISKAGISLSAGQHVLRISFDTAGPTGFIGNFDSVKLAAVPAPQTPFSGTPITVPATGIATIQAENFDNGGEGVAFHDTETANLGGQYRVTGVDIQATTDAGGGYNVGWTHPGEWLEYTLNIAQAGAYTLDFRIAAPTPGGSLHAELDSANLTGPLAIPSTGSWNNWQTLTKTGITLPAGQHILRIAFDTAGSSGFAGNLNWIKLTRA